MLDEIDRRKRVLVTGNPINGITLYGPFDSDEEALEFGEHVGHDTWWLTYLEDPA